VWDFGLLAMFAVLVWLAVSIIDVLRVSTGAAILLVAFDLVLAAALWPLSRWLWRNRPDTGADR
jgi:hypothetical protein